MTEKKPSKPAAKPAAKRTTSRKPKTQRTPSYDEISERAYYIHLEERESDPVANWLRAERELTLM
jgi:hypothetical protein